MKHSITPFSMLLALALIVSTPVQSNASSIRSGPVNTVDISPLIEIRKRSRSHRRSNRRNRRNRRAAIAAGVIGGIILGGIIIENRRRARRRSIWRDDAHVDWCYYHYRSYRAYDNTFQPYRGRRRPCYSPYY